MAVPGFYDKVRPLTDTKWRRKSLSWRCPNSEYLNIAGAPGMWGEAAYTADERIVARPTLEMDGAARWRGEGAKTVLPCKAMAKISCRLVANRDPWSARAGQGVHRSDRAAQRPCRAQARSTRAIRPQLTPTLPVV